MSQNVVDQAPSPIAPPATERREPGGFGRWWSNPPARALAALIFVILIGCMFNADGAFFKPGTHRDALRQASVYGILACGMTLVIICGGIDLSVGSVLAVSAVSLSIFSIHWGWPAWLAVLTCLGIGLACGWISGSLTSWFGIQPFIATLAMMVFARGLAKTISGGMKVSTAVKQADGTYQYVDVPSLYRFIDGRILGGSVSVVTIIFLICAAVAWVVLSRHFWGRHLYAIGSNEEASRLSGLPVAWSKALAYAVSGGFAALAGICQAAQEQQGDPEAGSGYELSAIAVVVIGGTSLAGGRGGMGLTLLGTFTIAYLEKILSINAVPEASRLMLTGGIIVLAVLAQSAGRKRTRQGAV